MAWGSPYAALRFFKHIDPSFPRAMKEGIREIKVRATKRVRVRARRMPQPRLRLNQGSKRAMPIKGPQMGVYHQAIRIGLQDSRIMHRAVWDIDTLGMGKKAVGTSSGPLGRANHFSSCN